MLKNVYSPGSWSQQEQEAMLHRENCHTLHNCGITDMLLILAQDIVDIQESRTF